jgi:ATP-dependent RNA helicase DeaD
MRGSIDLGALRAVVLDEADEMLDLGFQEDLEFILAACPETRRTLLFSATVPHGIANLAKKYQKDAIRITTTAEKSQHTDIEYRAMSVAARDAENAIINVLRFYEAPNALVFCNTRAMVNRLTTRLSNRGFSVVALSGELSQNERTHALQAMRDGRARVCVATDVAARGIDLPNLDLVVHAELPNSHETLLHRSGRTGRAGRKGVSAMIVPPASRKKCERILRAAKISADWTEAPSAEEVSAQDDARMLADPVWHQAVAESEADAVQKLVDQFSAEQIAAAYLHLFKSRQSAPEELSPPGNSAKPEPRAPFGPSVWFSVAGGRKAGAEPRRLLPMLCKAGNLTKDDIGAIRIQFDQSFVELRQEAVAGFVAALGDAMTVEGGAAVTQLAQPPELAPSPRPASKDRPQPRKPDAPRKPQPARPSEPKPRATQAPRPAPVAPPVPEPVSKLRPDMSDPSKSGRKGTPRGARKGDTQPVDWNDAPAPRVRKPKPGAKPEGGAKPKRRNKPEDNRQAGMVEPYKPRRDAGAPKPPFKGRKPKPGAAPPVGKPNSKKNKARALTSQKPGGGAQPPKRRTPPKS